VSRNRFFQFCFIFWVPKLLHHETSISMIHIHGIKRSSRHTFTVFLTMYYMCLDLSMFWPLDPASSSFWTSSRFVWYIEYIMAESCSSPQMLTKQYSSWSRRVVIHGQNIIYEGLSIPFQLCFAKYSLFNPWIDERILIAWLAGAKSRNTAIHMLQRLHVGAKRSYPDAPGTVGYIKNTSTTQLTRAWFCDDDSSTIHPQQWILLRERWYWLFQWPCGKIGTFPQDTK
jgi:hypothetical protein